MQECGKMDFVFKGKSSYHMVNYMKEAESIRNKELYHHECPGQVQQSNKYIQNIYNEGEGEIDR